MSDAIEIVERRGITEAEWDRVVESSPHGGPWSFWDWQELIGAVPRWELCEISFALLSGGRIVGVVPIHHIAADQRVACCGFGLTMPAVASSLPEDEHSRVLQAAFAEMARRAERLGAARIDAGLDAISVAAREGDGVNPLVQFGFTDASTHALVLDLTLDEDALLRQLSQDARHQIKRARVAGFSVRRVEWPVMLDAYYRVHVETYKRTGVLEHPKEYFAGIAKHRGPNGRAVLWAGFARDGRVVAFHNDARSHGGCHYHTGCCETDALKSGINYLLFWEAILGAKADGYRWYEIGEVFPNAAEGKERGLTVFKSKFGGEIRRLYRGSLSLAAHHDTAETGAAGTGELIPRLLRATHRLTRAVAGERTASLAKAAAVRGIRAARRAAHVTRSVARYNRLLVTGRIRFMRPLWEAEEDAAASKSNGDARDRLEGSFRRAAGVDADAEVVFTSSGRTALAIALSVLLEKHPGRRRVLLPSYSCRGLFDPIVRLGLVPDFVEVDEDLLPDEADTIARMRPDVLAYLAVHLCGCRMNTARIDAAARRSGIAVIEDCCHYLASTCSHADFRFFSFGLGKPIMATAGGALVTRAHAREMKAAVAKLAPDDSDVAGARYKHFRSTFFRPMGLAPALLAPDLVTQFGARLISDVDARLAAIQLDRLPHIIDARRRNATTVTDAASRARQAFRVQSQAGHTFTKWPLVFRQGSVANRFRDLMDDRGIELEPMYVPLHKREFARAHATRPLPFTDALNGCVLNVPIRPNLTTRELARIAETIAAFAGSDAN